MQLTHTSNHPLTHLLLFFRDGCLGGFLRGLLWFLPLPLAAGLLPLLASRPGSLPLLLDALLLLGPDRLPRGNQVVLEWYYSGTTEVLEDSSSSIAEHT